MVKAITAYEILTEPFFTPYAERKKRIIDLAMRYGLLFEDLNLHLQLSPTFVKAIIENLQYRVAGVQRTRTDLRLVQKASIVGWARPSLRQDDVEPLVELFLPVAERLAASSAALPALKGENKQ